MMPASFARVYLRENADRCIDIITEGSKNNIPQERVNHKRISLYERNGCKLSFDSSTKDLVNVPLFPWNAEDMLVIMGSTTFMDYSLASHIVIEYGLYLRAIADLRIS